MFFRYPVHSTNDIYRKSKEIEIDRSDTFICFRKSAMNKSDAPQKTLSEIIEAASSTESVQSNKIVRSNVPGN